MDAYSGNLYIVRTPLVHYVSRYSGSTVALFEKLPWSPLICHRRAALKYDTHSWILFSRT